MTVEHFDVVIIGAGLTGIGAACHLKMHCPGRRALILEGRETIGGTWDLFRYPGVRSDSDMYTLGYSFRPWRQAKAIADGGAILDYVRDTARAYGVDRWIRFGHRAVRANWSAAARLWTIEATRAEATRTEATRSGERVQFSCNFLFGCSGYYNYADGYMPDYAGAGDFAGSLIHPQHWPPGLDGAGKRIIVIGSGATAVTLVPALAQTAHSVTMLQRSPSYVVSLPSEDVIANGLRKRLPAPLAHRLARWKNVLLGIYFYSEARRRPDRARARIAELAQKALGTDYDVGTHFNPRYNPWDQRLCLVPDNNLFETLRSGKAQMVTDEIDRFTEHGIRLRSGVELPADIVVSATGLRMQFLGGMELCVDGVPVDPARTMTYRGMMLSEVPNFAIAFGYINASWTLKADLTCAYVCRLLNFMKRRNYAVCMPRRDTRVIERPLLDFSSGYVRRSIDGFPRQGTRKPWQVYQNYLFDLLSIRFGLLRDGTLAFSRGAFSRAASSAAPERCDVRETHADRVEDGADKSVQGNGGRVGDAARLARPARADTAALG
ncbi:flavin-containing monooxygenase [Lichenicoccus sp.]|uniref:flavin-containing monooxygenase n=1 Tax=Lichenicoccus sp. TaxID=2781899 RepID=UPI003D0D52D2